MVSPSDRLRHLSYVSEVLGIPFAGESNSAYMARAVSTVPPEERGYLEEIFSELVTGVKEAGLEAKVPVELSSSVHKEDINRLNHEQLFSARIVLPLTYCVSDGRGWEMGFSYTRKLLVPIVLKGQKINTPSICLPFQIPVVYSGKNSLVDLLSELIKYEVGFGRLDNQETVIGFFEEEKSDLRKVAKKFVEVLPY